MNEPLTPTERAARERLLRIGNAWATRPLYVDGDALNQDCLLVVNALDRLMSPAATPTEEVVPSDPVPDTHTSGLPVAPGGDVTTPSSPDVAALLANVNDIIESTRKYHVADRPNGYCEVCGIRMPCDKLLDAETFEELQDLCDMQAKKLAASEAERNITALRAEAELRESEELCNRWITAALRSAGTLSVAFDPTNPEAYMQAQTRYVLAQIDGRAAAEAERERLQRELDVADVLAHEEIARLQTALAKHRDALVGLVGATDPNELRRMEAFLAAVPCPDQAVTLAAVRVLLNAEPSK